MYTELISWENLYLAYRKAAKGKRGQAGVAAFEHKLEENLIALQNELRDKSYQPGEYSSFYIHEPKKRLISAAPFRDRVVHHALCNLIEPGFERSFIHDSYANRVGKGTHRALDRAQEFSRKYAYVLSCDLRQFFPSIDHAILFDVLKRKVSDQDMLDLISKILSGGKDILKEEYEMVYFAGDDLLAVQRPRGLPIGNLTSQFWANCYMNPFDHFVKRELGCRAYLRYVDDFLLFADSKKSLREWKGRIIQRLSKMRLTIHPGREPQPVGEGISFLGFRVYPDQRRLKRRKGIYYQRKLKQNLKMLQSGEMELEQFRASLDGWNNYVRYGNTIGLRKAVFGKCLVIRYDGDVCASGFSGWENCKVEKTGFVYGVMI